MGKSERYRYKSLGIIKIISWKRSRSKAVGVGFTAVDDRVREQITPMTCV